MLERVVQGGAAQVAGHLAQREAVVGPERKHDGVVAGRGLQLEVEIHAEALAERQPEPAVQPCAERRMSHQLHPAAVVEEPFQDEFLLGWKDSQLSQAGPVTQDERVKVTAALVDHPPVVPAFAFRFDGPDRSIVFSGDTNKSDNLVRLAQGADLLVHEALWVPAVDRLVARIPNAATLKKHIIDSHTAVEDVGRVAAAAGVKTLVLSHLVPADDPAITEQMWIDAARPYFKGEIVVARDGMEL